jgi:hypothetical protein
MSIPTKIGHTPSQPEGGSHHIEDDDKGQLMASVNVMSLWCRNRGSSDARPRGRPLW